VGVAVTVADMAAGEAVMVVGEAVMVADMVVATAAGENPKPKERAGQKDREHRSFCFLNPDGAPDFLEMFI
jgi:hypothetical protein